MNYINELKKAIDYIEDNLDKNINFEKVSKEVGMSSFYFHRIFTAIIGISLFTIGTIHVLPTISAYLSSSG